MEAPSAVYKLEELKRSARFNTGEDFVYEISKYLEYRKQIALLILKGNKSEVLQNAYDFSNSQLEIALNLPNSKKR